MRRVERYYIHDESIAAGGMASVHLARLAAEGGFNKIVAVKAMHAHLARDPDFRTMFLDEARTVSRIRHTNVVSTLDILADGDEMILVMDYVHGPSVSGILKHLVAQERHIPLPIAAKLTCDLLEGLHAAHEARSETGAPLEIVHRDVSPHNLLLGADGSARVMDFGIATASDRSYATKTGEVKGKAWYMPPEQARGERVDRRADIYSAGVVLYELLTNRTPFQGNYSEVMFKLFLEPVAPPSGLRSQVPDEVDAIVLRSLGKTADERFPTALAMSESLRDAMELATAQEVSEWLVEEMRPFFEQREALLKRLASEPMDSSRGARTDVGESGLDNTLANMPTVTAVPPAAVAAPAAQPAKRGRAVLLAAAVLAILGGAFVVRSKLSTATTVIPAASLQAHAAEPPSTPSVMPSTSAAPLASQSASPSPPASIIPLASASAVAKRHPIRTPPPPPTRSAATVSSSSPAAPTAPQPMCCLQIGGTWQRYGFTNCVNNCPAGAQ